MHSSSLDDESTATMASPTAAVSGSTASTSTDRQCKNLAARHDEKYETFSSNRTTRHAKQRDDSNNDEKKESDSATISVSSPRLSTAGTPCSITAEESQNIDIDQGGPCESSAADSESLGTSFASLVDLSGEHDETAFITTTPGVEPISSVGGNSGLHHRHHHHQNNPQQFPRHAPNISNVGSVAIITSTGSNNSNSSSTNNSSLVLNHTQERFVLQASPTRRRRARPVAVASASNKSSSQRHFQNHNQSYWETHFRRKKWTFVQFFRAILLGGGVVYFFVMIRGTQILMEHEHDDNSPPKTSENNAYRENDRNVEVGRTGFSLGDLLGLPRLADNGIVNNGMDNNDHNIHGYLRSSSSSLLSMGAPKRPNHPPKTADPETVRRMIEQRNTERRNRTRPPIRKTPASSITPYEIIPIDKQPRKSRHQQGKNHKRAENPSPPLANRTQLCGAQARQASQLYPGAFLQQDVLNSSARVLITGILSDPIAFHLALTLKAQCGVEVLIGVDPMLPNTISSRMQYVEQMKILAADAPKMVQPILVPLLGLHPRVKKSKKDASAEYPRMLKTTGEVDLNMNFKPTHIVHLSTATFRNPRTLEDPTQKYPSAPKRPLSPYQTSEKDSYEPSLFQIRNSMTAMEQLLASLVSGSEDGSGSQPHFTYASAPQIPNSDDVQSETIMHARTKLADEVLADTYHSIFGIYSVGVRIPPNSVYGPWDYDASDMYKIMERAIHGNHSSVDHLKGTQELIYVQDAVEAILAAMQFRGETATNFDMTANAALPLSDVQSMANSFVSATKSNNDAILPKKSPGSLSTARQAIPQLQWRPQTPLRDGILRTLAWHLDRERPNGPPLESSREIASSATFPSTGDDLLRKHDVETCSADDLVCHAGASFLPCASECSIKSQCKVSVFDRVRELTRNMTEGCDAVLYTQSLGLDVEDLQLQSQFEDDMEPAICNLAFVAERSPLVKAVIEKIPDEELKRLGVPASTAFSKKLERLNGRLLYRGWILIWVERSESISTSESSLLKLSPGRMFAADVLYAVFVEENFSVSPTTDDVRFLISQMDRGATKQRNIYRMVKKNENSKSKKVKLTLPEQPEKRASVLLSQLKFKLSEKGRIPQDTKISIMDAVRFMRFEIGLDPTKQKESAEVKLQKDFYRRIPSFINGKDLRDSFEPLYKYELKHWVRTRWVVHDLTLEESRDLRCDWYREHVQWGNDLDQLSFAAIMAKRVLERRLMLSEPDDRSKQKNLLDLPPDIKAITDNDEWFGMATEQNKLHFKEQYVTAIQQVQDAVAKDEMAEDGAEEESDVSAGSDFSQEKKLDAGLYVRIISDRIMSLSRKAWSRYRQELAQAEKAQ